MDKMCVQDASMQANKPRPGVGVAAIVTSDKHPRCVILGKRKGKIGSGLYQLPGGHLEFGESWEDAAIREVLEETGLHITNICFCGAVNSVVPEIDYHYVTIFMKGSIEQCGPSEPQNLEPDKCEGWEWIEWGDLPEADLLFYALKDFTLTGINPIDM
ncbi:nucleotide triphosphate diphosphatase NUDT15-like [Uloborus diversus]|uniref:nucleotide triphosphate diphosphatase NUDT15-like n=1 Tax=Uloborus diversus TaxID=327109 RepID=UPI002408F913|nr:nucleotide triphosphate diphosphatase NUDT15-like [Uloborus diversus]